MSADCFSGFNPPRKLSPALTELWLHITALLYNYSLDMVLMEAFAQKTLTLRGSELTEAEGAAQQPVLTSFLYRPDENRQINKFQFSDSLVALLFCQSDQFVCVYFHGQTFRRADSVDVKCLVVYFRTLTEFKLMNRLI